MARTWSMVLSVVALLLIKVLLTEIHGLHRREVLVWLPAFMPKCTGLTLPTVIITVNLIEARVQVIRYIPLFGMVMCVVYEAAINPKSVMVIHKKIELEIGQGWRVS